LKVMGPQAQAVWQSIEKQEDIMFPSTFSYVTTAKDGTDKVVEKKVSSRRKGLRPDPKAPTVHVGKALRQKFWKGKQQWFVHNWVIQGSTMFRYHRKFDWAKTCEEITKDPTQEAKLLKPEATYGLRHNSTVANLEGLAFCVEVQYQGVSAVLMMSSEATGSRDEMVAAIRRAIDDVAKAETPIGGTVMPSSEPADKAKDATEEKQITPVKKGSRIVGKSVTRGHQGTLSILRKGKPANEKWDTRLFVLTDRHLAYYSKTEFMPDNFNCKEGKMALMPERGFQLTKQWTVLDAEIVHGENAFDLIDPDLNTVATFKAESADERDEWMNMIDSTFRKTSRIETDFAHVEKDRAVQDMTSYQEQLAGYRTVNDDAYNEDNQHQALGMDDDDEEEEEEPEEEPEKPITADHTGFLGVFRSHQKGFKGGNSIAARSVKSKENWRWHYYVLSGLELLYYPSTQKEVLGVGGNAKKDSDGQKRKLQPKGKYIIRDDTSPADSDGNSFCLEVTDNGMSKVLLMVTEHAEDKKLWVENINKAIATRKAEKVASGEDKENTASTVSTSANMRSPLRPSNGTAATREGPSKKMSGPWSVTDSKENSAAGAKPAMDSNKGMSTKERCKAISSNDKPSATPYDVTKGASITGFLNVYRSKWKGWQTRFFVLQDKTLWYYPTNEDIMKASEKTSLGDGTFVRLQPEGGLQIPEGCSVIEGDAKYKRKYCIEVVDSLINTVVVLACETHMEKCTWISKLKSFFSTDHVCASDDIKNKAGGGLRRSKDQDITKSKKDPVNITWEDKTADNYQMLPTLELND